MSFLVTAGFICLRSAVIIDVLGIERLNDTIGLTYVLWTGHYMITRRFAVTMLNLLIALNGVRGSNVFKTPPSSGCLSTNIHER